MSDEKNDAPRDAGLSLPWYATGKLSAQERAEIEDALANDAELRRQLALVRDEAEETIALNESLKTAPAAGLSRIMSQIDLHEAAHPRHAGFGDKILRAIATALESLSPRNLAFAGIAAAAVICLQAGLLTGLLIHRQENKPTLKVASVAGTNETGTFALVAFVGTTTLQQVGDFLTAQHAELRDGPKPGGFYRIRISDQLLSPAALDARLAEFRAHPDIVQLILPEPTKH